MKSKHPFILFSCMLLFFMWGLITVLNDILVPHLKALFALSYAQVMLIQFCFFVAYGLMSLPASRLIDNHGYKKTLCIGLLIASLGALFFLPAAHFGVYSLFLLGLFILATGIVVLQVSANPYVALLGPHKTASSRLNLSQAFNSLGTTIGPLLGSSLILSVLQDEKSEVLGIEYLYFGIAVLLLILFVFISLVKFPKIQKEKYQEFEESLGTLCAIKEKIPLSSTLKKTLTPFQRFPHLFLGAIAIFCYVGAEVSIGSFLVNFLTQKQILGVDTYTAGNLVSIYWGLAMIGRFIGFFILLKLSSRKVLMTSACLAFLLVLSTLSFSGTLAGFSLISVGLFNSVMFPTIFSLAIAGLEKYTPQGSGILCAAIVGGATIPLIQGLFADMLGIHHAFFIPLLCYGYIFYYGFKGSIASCKV